MGKHRSASKLSNCFSTLHPHSRSLQSTPIRHTGIRNGFLLFFLPRACPQSWHLQGNRDLVTWAEPLSGPRLQYVGFWSREATSLMRSGPKFPLLLAKRRQPAPSPPLPHHHHWAVSNGCFFRSLHSQKIRCLSNYCKGGLLDNSTVSLEGMVPPFSLLPPPCFFGIPKVLVCNPENTWKWEWGKGCQERERKEKVNFK